MGIWDKWKRKSFGKKLSMLHAWNAWLVLLLTVSGILLFIQPFRELGVLRVWTKEGHIWLGLLSTVIVLIYLPRMLRHIKQLKGKPEQQWNLGIVLILLVGWIVTGILLWQFRQFPPIWSNFALILHDLFTWVGVPYALYHSVTRSRWLKMRRRGAVMQRESTSTEIISDGIPPKTELRSVKETVRDVMYTRRSFIRWGLAGLLIVLIGPKFGRWLLSGGGGGIDLQTYDPSTSGNRMLPAPQPLPESIIPIGGGSQGHFRVYTVTPIPSFSSDNWKFTIYGLVDHPQSWDWNQLTALARSVQVSDFHCVTGWSVYNNTWEGITLSKLLDMAGVQAKARVVKFYSGDRVYTDALTLTQAALDDIMVAVLLDGKPIPQELGGPVRLIVPKMYAYKSVKWLQSIELIDSDHIGYWEERGYEMDAWVPKLKS